jgi:hypothetical protein
MRRTPEMLAVLKGSENTLADPASKRDQPPEWALGNPVSGDHTGP